MAQMLVLGAIVSWGAEGFFGPPVRSLGLALVLMLAQPGCASTPRGNARPGDPFKGMVAGAQVVMGTRLFIAIAQPEGQRGADLLSRAFTIARSYDALLSTYKRDSALTRLNAGTLPAPHPAPLIMFAKRSHSLCRTTGGAFDISVGSLLWLQRQGAQPHGQAHQRALASMGCDAYVLRDRRILLRPSVRLDPGAIGKGIAVDAIISMLRRSGVDRAFINFGGSSFFGLGKGWRVAVERAESRRVSQVVQLDNAGLSSSKSVVGARSHIVDPRTGRRVSVARRAAVITRSATVGEALSTALVVDPQLAASLRRKQKQLGLLWLDVQSAP